MTVIITTNSETIQGPQQNAIINAPKVLEFNNQVCIPHSVLPH
jgi:hypothetical protein